MQLNRSTDYAIRMLICLSKASGAISSSKLARAIGVSPRYLLQIGARLRDAGFVHVGHGPTGGYQLSRPPAKISLMDVIMAINHKNNALVLPDRRPSQEEFHTLEYTYQQLEKWMQRQLESITILKLSQTEEWKLRGDKSSRYKEKDEQTDGVRRNERKFEKELSARDYISEEKKE